MILKGIEYTANQATACFLFLTFYKPSDLWIAFSCSKVANLEYQPTRGSGVNLLDYNRLLPNTID